MQKDSLINIIKVETKIGETDCFCTKYRVDLDKLLSGDERRYKKEIAFTMLSFKVQSVYRFISEMKAMFHQNCSKIVLHKHCYSYKHATSL